MTTPSWKDHPVIVLGTAFGAGVAFALTVAVPLYNTSAQNAYDEKLRRVEEQYASDKADIANVQDLKKNNLFFRSQLIQARVELWQLADKKPFRASSPIPVGLEPLRPGMKIEDVKALLPNSTFSEEGGYLYVSLKGGLIEQLQIKVTKGRVNHITYYAGDNANSKGRLLGAVIAAYGQPVSKTTDDDGDPHFFWKVNGQQVSVFGSQYSVSEAF